VPQEGSGVRKNVRGKDGRSTAADLRPKGSTRDKHEKMPKKRGKPECKLKKPRGHLDGASPPGRQSTQGGGGGEPFYVGAKEIDSPETSGGKPLDLQRTKKGAGWGKETPRK